MEISCHAFIATSLDGFIARVDGSIDWLEQANLRIPAGEDCGYQSFFNQMDCLVLGRKSFETVIKFPQWPYGDKQVFVMSRSGFRPAAGVSVPATVEFSEQSTTALLTRLESQGTKNVYIDGGSLIQSFLKDDLLTEVTITRIPILLGNGIPLFGNLSKDVHLKLIESRHWTFGFVQDRYLISSR
ncbi:MAG: hypothetical protein RL189_57 [Pseudomonadota bacterium]|jgi:dihydrofolate reductase